MSLKQKFQKQYQSTYAMHQAEIDSGDFDEIWNDLVEFAICQIQTDENGQVDPQAQMEIEDFVATDETSMATAVEEAYSQIRKDFYSDD